LRRWLKAGVSGAGPLGKIYRPRHRFPTCKKRIFAPSFWKKLFSPPQSDPAEPRIPFWGRQSSLFSGRRKEPPCFPGFRPYRESLNLGRQKSLGVENSLPGSLPEKWPHAAQIAS